jgi:hypothetical protein
VGAAIMDGRDKPGHDGLSVAAERCASAAANRHHLSKIDNP